MATSISYEDVERVARELHGQGKSPTLREVRERLGAGSFTTIQKHLATFRERLDANDGSPDLPASVVKVAEAQQRELWDRALAQARSKVSAEIATALRERDTARSELSESLAQIERGEQILKQTELDRDRWHAKAEEIEHDRSAAVTTLADCRQRIASLTAELASRKENEASCQAHIKTLQGQVYAMSTALSTAQSQIDVLTQAIADEQLANRATTKALREQELLLREAITGRAAAEAALTSRVSMANLIAALTRKIDGLAAETQPRPTPRGQQRQLQELLAHLRKLTAPRTTHVHR